MANIRFSAGWVVGVVGWLVTGSTSLSGSALIPPAHYLDRNDSRLHNRNGVWYLNQLVFSGYILEKENDHLLAKLPVINGREQGIAYGWYPTGRKRYERGFYQGNREGMHRGWYPNGQLSFAYHFHDDKYEGEQLSYYASGHRWQRLHYLNGYEEGQQKTWNDSGRVVNNFTVKKGKLYGVIGRYDCMSVYQK